MKSICLYFQIHQPCRLRSYRFTDIGSDHYYYDDFANSEIIERIARRSYIPATETLKEMVATYGKKFKAAISITGTALEQLEQYVPEFIDSLKELVATGNVEFLSETYAHSLASLTDIEEFQIQIKNHAAKIKEIFGVAPTKVLRNTELIYNDDIAAVAASMGFKGMITDGAKHILGWKSPNYLYNAASAPKLKLLLKNAKFSDDITFHFSDTAWSNYPLTADKFMGWIAATPQEEQIINLFMNFETLGELQPAESGIFEFLKALPRFAEDNGITFVTPLEAVTKLKSVGELVVPHPISWTDEARDTSAWLGNDLQNEAFNKLYSIAERVRLCDDRRIKQDWNYLQTSDHFFYMCTKHFSDGSVHANYSPYETPYTAFTNYMNVLSDFIVRVEEQYPLEIENEELNALVTTIRNQAAEIDQLKKQVELLKTDIVESDEVEAKPVKKAPAKKVAEKKPAEKKAPAEKKPVAEKPAKKAPAKKATKK